MSETSTAGKEAGTIEGRTRAIGRELFAAVGRGPSVLDRAWWDDRFLGLAMNDREAKVRLFRFIDVLPALRGEGSVRRHLDEYFRDDDGRLADLVRLVLSAIERDRFLDPIVRGAARRMAARFIAGSNPAEAVATALRLRRRQVAFTADLLGEAVVTESEADAYGATCLDLIRSLAPVLADRPEVPRIDRDDLGPIPRMNLSLKLTSLTTGFDALHPGSTARRVLDRLRPILRAAREHGAFVNVDMEQFAYKDLTYAIFRQVLDEPEFRDWRDVGIVCQAYLRDAEADLHALNAWADRRGTPVAVRLVKGAYWDYEVLHARQEGWPIPVYTEKWESDASFERCARVLLANRHRLRPAFASHNVRSLSYALATAEILGVPEAAFEVQMLHGMGEPIQRALVARGLRLRVYTPYGAILPGMAYLVRRLLENTSNESFLKASFVDHARVEDLLRDPEEVGAMLRTGRRSQATPTPAGALPPFRNEPPTDFSRAEAREALRKALDDVRGRLGRTIPMSLDGRWIEPDADPARQLRSTDPSESSRVVGVAPLATARQAEQAVASARRRLGDWADTPIEGRGGVLIEAAKILRRRRFELCAWEVFECAKPWREADGDIAEAIDFCEFYAREILRTARPRHEDVPGETNASEYGPRGVVVVIPPWNFPLAIPMGMTVAALVAGNAVILKPAEQSPVMAYQLARVLEEAGLPPGVLQLLPGTGEEVGQALVTHPDVDLIAFTGSRDVGLQINRQAAEPRPGQDHVKRVIAEMGGKNAIIVDDDADLDEAVSGVLRSAFGYAGQKCSACSRVIVVGPIYGAFTERLAQAVGSLRVGPAEDPDTDVPAVISAEARARILDYYEVARSEGRVVARVDVGPLADRGHYVGPLVVADVAPASRLAREEIFGPVLAVFPARDIDEALAIANDSIYALTGGLYSRSPAHIELASKRFRVGNLYINRPITGALVGRQPFGGFKLSGIGTKAGGPDYLHEFLLARTITENTMRRGFGPDSAITSEGG